MKKILFSTCLSLITAITVPVCFADGQATYAVVDSSGVVQNIIVCTESVCGSNGSWKGKMPADTSCPNCKLVLQVPANPVTGQNQGGYLGKEPGTEVRYDEQKQVFTQGSTTTPVPVTKSEQEVTSSSTTTLTATINSTSVSFGPNNFANGVMNKVPNVDSTTGAVITVSQTDNTTLEITATESQEFSTPQTRQQVTDAVANKPLISSRLTRFFNLLGFWLMD